jgi:L-rhamnose mutarotase
MRRMLDDTERSEAMLRKAFVMHLRAGCEEEYRRRHNPIWPEMAAALKARGAKNYSIFLHRETNQLFGYVEIDDETQWSSMAQTDVCRRWWAYMAPLMATNPDHSPVTQDLAEVFHLD